MQLRSTGLSLDQAGSVVAHHIADDERSIYVVASLCGDPGRVSTIASTVVGAVADSFRAWKEHLLSQGKWKTCSVDEVKRALHQAFCVAQEFFYGLPDCRECSGVSLVTLVGVREQLVVAHVGSAGFFLIREGGVHRCFETIYPLERASLVLDQKSGGKGVNFFTFEAFPGDGFALCPESVADDLDFDPAAVSGGLSGEDVVGHLKQQLLRAGVSSAAMIFLSVVESGNAAIERLAEFNEGMRALQGVSLFRELSYLQLLKVLALSAISHHGPGAPIILQGSGGDSLYIVLEGDVVVHQNDTILAKLATGEHFGEMAILSNSPRNASVSAQSATRLLTVPSVGLRNLINDDTGLGVKFLWQLSSYLCGRLVMNR